MGSMSIMHWAIVAGIVALLFGRGKISGLMEDMALGIKSFKNGMKEDDVHPVQDAGVPSRATEPLISRSVTDQSADRPTTVNAGREALAVKSDTP